MLSNAVGYDWATWLMGVMRAFISGVGGAFAGGAGPGLVDPDHFNMSHPALLLKSMFVGALISGIVALGTFLHTHGAPEKSPPVSPTT